MTAQGADGPATTPCTFCPYRRDVPSGVWAPEEYAKLPAYDKPTGDQPPGVFLCHLRHPDNPKGWTPHVCAGWAGCHDGDHLLALRIARFNGTMTGEAIAATAAYKSPVDLFESGAAAAAHGMRDADQPGPEAWTAMDRISVATSHVPRDSEERAWKTRS